MGKWLLGLAIGLVVLLALAAAGVIWWTQDANRLKPQIENLLTEDDWHELSADQEDEECEE